MVCSFFIPKMKGVRKIATTGIWKIEKRLDNVIDYTTNIEKTINSDYGKDSYYDLHNVIDYVEADYKTEKQFYVSGVNCNPKTALEEMTITKEQYGKTGGILGFHAFQSFAEGEVTPEQCHAIGVRLAEEMWGDRFEVVVSTHLNTNHYHNHFVINSVSFKDGKRYYDKRETYAELRRLSDSLCEEYGLSVLKEKPCRNSRINFANYQKDNNNKVNYYSIAKNDLEVCIEIFFVRGSKMVGREYYFFQDLIDMSDNEILSGFIKQYYMDNPNLPNKIMMRNEPEDKETIETWLSNIANRKVEIKTPQKGEKLRFVEMAENNAEITLKNKFEDKNSLLLELKDVLKMDKMPRKIECYDISNISGTNIVAGMCVMQNGIIKKNLSRRFKIKTVYGQDDPRCMEEVIERRLKHSLNGNSTGFGNLPDVIFVDGGITQIRAAKRVINKLNVDIKIFGMVKNDKHRTRALMDENRNEIEISEELLNLITKFQDTVHDTAISYHKKLREKEMTESVLDKISGIGEAKRNLLLKRFKTVSNIKKASEEEIMTVKGINKELAIKIKQELQ